MLLVLKDRGGLAETRRSNASEDEDGNWCDDVTEDGLEAGNGDGCVVLVVLTPVTEAGEDVD